MAEEKPADERIRAVAALIKTGSELMGMLNKAEREVIVAQTLSASVANLDAGAGAFSYYGKGLDIESRSQMVENSSSYRWLLNEGYLTERENEEGRRIIEVTEKLLSRVEAHVRAG